MIIKKKIAKYILRVTIIIDNDIIGVVCKIFKRKYLGVIDIITYNTSEL